VTCHGNYGGESVDYTVIEPTKTDYFKGTTGPLTLEAFIDAYMPGTGTRSVSTQEATNIAAFIRADMPSAEKGKVLYSAAGLRCDNCHGVDGMGATPLITAELIVFYPTFEELSTKISATMPRKNTALGTAIGNCDKACADNIAKYILTNF
jgi:cytochrome c